MTLMTDHNFRIGAQHLAQGKPCQDYALSGTLSDTLAYALVSDGCSSGGYTDIGARLMCLANEQALRTHQSLQLDEVAAESTGQLIAMGQALGLSPRDLLATSLTAVMNDNNSFTTQVRGDGVVATLYEDGTLLAYRYEWSENAPYYPIYTGQLRTQFQSSERTLTRECWRLEPECVLIEEKVFSVKDNVFSDTISHTRNVQNQCEPICIAVFSDGVEQVENISWQETVTRLMAFKSTKGQFAVRRMKRFIQEATKVGRGPVDDIAMAVITWEATQKGVEDVSD